MDSSCIQATETDVRRELQMSRYPRGARSAAITCIPCNAPVTETIDGEYVCVCGGSPVQDRSVESVMSGGGD